MRTVQEVGESAGKLWKTMKDNGAQTIVELETETGLSRESVCGGLGWLARENKLIITKEGRFTKYDLTTHEKGHK